jgi:hypothetical protein
MCIFIYKPPDALNYTYTLTTKHSGIESILAELQKIAPVRFEYKGENVFVTL